MSSSNYNDNNDGIVGPAVNDHRHNDDGDDGDGMDGIMWDDASVRTSFFFLKS